MRNQEEKIELQKKVRRRVCVRDIIFLAARTPFHVIFCRFFRLLQFYEEKNFFCRKKWGASAPCFPPPSVYGPVVVRKTQVTMKNFSPPFFDHFSLSLNRKKNVW